MKRMRVADKKSKTQRLLVGASLSIKDIVEILESMGYELDDIHQRLEQLEKRGSKVDLHHDIPLMI